MLPGKKKWQLIILTSIKNMNMSSICNFNDDKIIAHI